MRVFEGLARAFVVEGTGTAFGVMGDANLGWFAAMIEAGVEMVSARHEAAAVAMADGFAQGSGRVGVCGVTSGPGLAHVVVPLLAAARGDVPLVVFAGDLPGGRRGNPADLDHRRVVELCEAEFVPVVSAASALGDVRRAFYRARVDRRPVVVNVPMDVAAAELVGGWEYSPVVVGRQRLGSDPVVRASVVDLIAGCRRPVVVAGRGAVESGASEALLALAARVGALVATTIGAKGWLDEDPFAVGVVGPLRSAVAEELFGEADLVLVFGSALDRYTRVEGGVVFPGASLVSVNTDVGARPAHEPADVHVVGDARRVAVELLEDLEQRGIKQDGFRTAEVSERLRAAAVAPDRPRSHPLDPRDVMRVLEGHLGPNHDVIAGVGHFFAFPIMNLRRGGRFFYPLRAGSIGYTLPTGIGAARANLDRAVVVIEGDGSLMQYIGEIETAVRHGLRLLVLVMNDQALGAEMFKLRAAGFNSEYAVMPTPDFSQVARAFGADGALVTNPDELDAALTHFDRHGGVYVIDARVDRDSMNDMYRKLQLGEPNRAPHQRDPSL